MNSEVNADVSTLLDNIGSYIDKNKNNIIKDVNEKIAARLSNGADTYFASPSIPFTDFNATQYLTAPQTQMSNDDIIAIVNNTVDEYCKKAINDFRMVRTTYVDKVEATLQKALGKNSFINNLKTYDQSAYFIEDKVYEIVDEIKGNLLNGD